VSRGLNEIKLIGHLGNDPEVRYTTSGKAVTTIKVATSEQWTQDGEEKERTEWHRCVGFDKLGEIMGEYLKKGQRVYLSGKMHYGSYDKDGVTHYTADVYVKEMLMLSDGRGRQDEDKPSPRNTRAPAEGRGERPPARTTGRGESAPRNDDPFPDDDIPF
jgi:single-strand DNA-binding protein